MTKKQKLEISIARLEQIVSLPKDDIYTEANRRVKIAKLRNLSSATARYLTEDNRVVLLITLTFQGDYRFDIQKMSNKQIIRIASMQHQGITSFLKKLRDKFKSQRVRHFIVTELQADGNLHSHLQLSIPLELLFKLIEAIHKTKARYTKEYLFNGKGTYPIGRTHIGLSARYKKMFQKRYKLRSYSRKALDENEISFFEKEPTVTRTEHYMINYDTRIVQEGNWTPIEFYTMSLLEELHGEAIEKYLIKTLTGEFKLDLNSIKEGVLKARLGYDTKTLTEVKEDEKEAYVTMIQTAFVRKICKKAYSHSRMPFPFKVYQTHRKALIALNPEYKVFYRCIEALREGELSVHKEVIYNVDGNVIRNRLKGV